MAEIGKTKKKRLKLDAVMQAVHKLPLGVRSDFEIQERLLGMLKALAEEGVIGLPSLKTSWDPMTRLPNFVRVDRSEDDTEKQRRKERLRRLRYDTAWEPTRMVRFAHKLKTIPELERAAAVNQYLLHRKPGVEMIPHRERALEIFGDEKALDGTVKKGLFSGRISLADLDCFHCPEPLPFRPFSLNIEKTRGLPLLVVENSCTYWSCCRANDSLGRYAAVVYGKGFEACASDQGAAVERASDGLRGIEEQVGASDIRYFGDLDPTGLAIPRRINRHRESAGLPPMAPEVRLYDRLLRRDRATPSISSQTRDHDPDWAREWLGEDLAEVYLSKSGSARWPQEGVTWRDMVDALS